MHLNICLVTCTMCDTSRRHKSLISHHARGCLRSGAFAQNTSTFVWWAPYAHLVGAPYFLQNDCRLLICLLPNTLLRWSCGAVHLVTDLVEVFGLCFHWHPVLAKWLQIAYLIIALNFCPGWWSLIAESSQITNLLLAEFCLSLSFFNPTTV